MGVRRYGAHGISYESIVYQLQPNVPEKLIVAHLGNGASISAIRNGKCLDTSMGLTPTGGIISGTRTGDIDPGVLLFILRKIAETTKNASDAADQLEAVANKKAGLLGVSDLSNDMRDLREAIDDGQRQGAPRRRQIHMDDRQDGSAVMWPSWADWTCLYSLAASARTTLTRAPRSAPAWARWASCSIQRATTFAARPSSPPRIRRYSARDSAGRRSDDRQPCCAPARSLIRHNASDAASGRSRYT